MSRTAFARYLMPWTLKREKQQQRVAELRQRDGDDCRRCRRPILFDKPAGHELAARIEAIGSSTGGNMLSDLCLTHGRCNAQGRDHTDEVIERLRPRREAELLIKARVKRRAA